MAEQSESSSGRRRRSRGNESGAAKAARVLEWIGGGLLCLLLAATPWMYGTTEEWSIRTMNVGSFAAGGILLVSALTRRFGGTAENSSREEREGTRRERVARWGFLAVNLLVLAFCVVALFNARAVFSVTAQSFTYFEGVKNYLPTTYDANLTRETLINWTACFCAFWGLRHWILRGGRSRSGAANRRFVLFFWVLSMNGFLIALQGVLQRLSGSSKLLWIRDSYYGTAVGCFGPFSYRGNGAEYINLIWPAAVGFWWFLNRERRKAQGGQKAFSDGPELLLIPAVIVMLAGVFTSLSRGGVVIAAASVLVLVVALALEFRTSRAGWISTGAVLAALGGLLVFLGWENVVRRFTEPTLETFGGRIEIYENARQIAADFPVFGVGPGAFRSVYHLYRESTAQPWHGYLHDDWLETLATMGWTGLSLVVLQLALLAWWITAPGRMPVPRLMVMSAAIGLIGCLLHAKFDFPLQTYSIVFTFVAIAAALTTVSPERR